MGCGIYGIKNIINNKIYIGSSIHIQKRISEHKRKLRKNQHCNEFLQRSFNKYGTENFNFFMIEECFPESLINKENFYINKFKSDNNNFGYNLATVNEYRRNNFNDYVKHKNSIKGLIYYNNFTNFKIININTDQELTFDNLFDCATYLIEFGFAKGSNRNVRIKISQCLRGKKVNTGLSWSKRKTVYKHKCEIL